MSVSHASSAYKKTNKEQLRQITTELEGKIEMQSMVLKYIQTLRDAKESADSQGQKFGDLLMSTRKRKRGDNTTDQLAEVGGKSATRPTIGDDKMLPRNCASYKVWGVKLLRELLAYLAPGVMTLVFLNECDKQMLQELIEYSTDIRIAGGHSDTTGSLQKRMVFDSVAALYDKNGARLYELEDMSPWDVDWHKVGHYQAIVKKSSDGAKVLVVKSKPLEKEVEVPSDIWEGINISKVTIASNYSQYNAYITLANKDQFKVQNLFPMLGRTLRRATSDEGATTAGTGGGLLKLCQRKAGVGAARVPSWRKAAEARSKRGKQVESEDTDNRSGSSEKRASVVASSGAVATLGQVTAPQAPPALTSAAGADDEQLVQMPAP